MIKNSKSDPLKELEKKLSREIKKVSEDLIKEKLDKKKLDYDTISLILEVFGKSKFQWKPEHTTHLYWIEFALSCKTFNLSEHSFIKFL